MRDTTDIPTGEVGYNDAKHFITMAIEMTPERLQTLLSSFPRLTIGLVGDLFLDRYLHLAQDVHELSIETGEEAYQIDGVRNSPGALGTVMNNLAALGVGLLVPVTVIGDDGHGYDVLREVGKLPVDKSHVLCYRDRLTPTYTKPMRPQSDGSWRELNRLDVRTRGPLTKHATDEVCQRVRDVFRSSDGLIVLDQINESNWGVVNAAVRATIEQIGRENPGKLIFVDSRAHLERFTSCTLKGNRNELTRAAQELNLSGEALQDLALELAKRNDRNVYVTQGENGIFLARPSGSTAIAHGISITGPIDIVGAGDSATSGIVTSLLAGATDEEAALVGNLVASITIEQLGTTGKASPQQVRERLERISP